MTAAGNTLRDIDGYPQLQTIEELCEAQTSDLYPSEIDSPYNTEECQDLDTGSVDEGIGIHSDSSSEGNNPTMAGSSHKTRHHVPFHRRAVYKKSKSTGNMFTNVRFFLGNIDNSGKSRCSGQINQAFESDKQSRDGIVLKVSNFNKLPPILKRSKSQSGHNQITRLCTPCMCRYVKSSSHVLACTQL